VSRRRSTGGNEVGADTLRRDLLGRFDLEPKSVAIEPKRFIEIADGDADMIENGFHGSTSHRAIVNSEL
jgi:hypothetical protein